MKIKRILVCFPYENQAHDYLGSVLNRLVKIKNIGVVCNRESIEIQCKGRYTVIYALKFEERKILGCVFDRMIIKPVVDHLLNIKAIYENKGRFLCERSK